MLIEIKLWRSFVVLSEELNFRRAAERLGVSQPALTKQIQELEVRLDVILFRREPRGVELTETAKANLKEARTLITAAERLERRFKTAATETAQRVKIGALEYITRHFLPGALQIAHQQLPGLKASIQDMTPTEAMAAAADGRIDLGVALSPVTEPNLVARPIVEGRWLLVLPKDHALSTNEHIPITALADERLLIFARRLNPDLYDKLVASFEAKAAGFDIAYHAQDPSVGAEMVASGLGLFIVASYALSPLPDGLIARPLADLDERPVLNAVWRRDRMTAALRTVLDALDKALETD